MAKQKGHKAGFRLPQKTERFVFGGDYEGAEVVCKISVPLGFIFEMQEASEDPRTVMARFAEDVLLEWNLEDEKGPVPADAKGVMRVPNEFMAEVILKWTDRVMNVPGPLDTTSNDGDTLVELSTVSETTSANRHS